MSNILDKWKKHKKHRQDNYKEVKLSNKNKRRLNSAIEDTFWNNTPVSLNNLFAVKYGEALENLIVVDNPILKRIQKEKSYENYYNPIIITITN